MTNPAPVPTDIIPTVRAMANEIGKSHEYEADYPNSALFERGKRAGLRLALDLLRCRDPLNEFADRWELDGDYIRCRACHRPQIIGMAHHDFRHAAGCRGAEWERNPWKSLSGLLTAAIAKAEVPGD